MAGQNCLHPCSLSQLLKLAYDPGQGDLMGRVASLQLIRSW